MREDPSSFLLDWHHRHVTTTARLQQLLVDHTARPYVDSWPAIPAPFMAGQPSRVPPPHQPPLDAVAGASNRPKPLWQPWSDSDDDSKMAGQEPTTGGHQNKELPSRTKKERRRHERHHELLSRSRKEVAVQDEADRPLDMSTGSRRSSPPPPYASAALNYPPRYPSPPEYSSSSGRPSVITCASSLRSSPAPSCPSPCGSTGSTASNPNPHPPRSHSSPPVQRREIISSGMCDPVIDEHFRRSLGERYTHLFAPTSSGSSSSSAASPLTGGGGNDPAGSRDGSSSGNSKLPSTVNVTGLSVDDHFAKALGETWLKLQSETNKEKEGGSARESSQPGSPLPASASAARHGLLLT